MAPSVMACHTRFRIASISSLVAGRWDASSPITHRRTAQWPTLAERFTPIRPSRARRKSAKLPPEKVTPALSASGDIPSTRLSICSSQGTSAGLAGAKVNPQLPEKTVVTPCHDEGDAVGSKNSWAS